MTLRKSVSNAQLHSAAPMLLSKNLTGSWPKQL